MVAKTNQGFSLIELIVVLGIVSILSLAMSQVMVQNAKNQNAQNFNDQIVEATRELNSIFARTDVCTANFMGLAAGANVNPPGTTPGPGASLTVLKYNITGGTDPSNIIATVGKGENYRGTNLTLSAVTLLPYTTTGPQSTLIDTATGIGSLFLKVTFGWTGAQSQIASTTTKDRYFQIYANFANTMPVASIPSGNSAIDQINLSMNCQAKAVNPALPSPPIEFATLGNSSTLTSLNSPFNGTPILIQDCMLIRLDNPIITSCN